MLRWNLNAKDTPLLSWKGLKKMFDTISKKYSSDNIEMKTLSMGMSSDYKIAVEEGSNMVRLGGVIFGERKAPITSL